MTNRSDHSVAPDQLPLAELVKARRWEMALSQGQVARLMQKAAEQAGDPYCLATRQSVSEYEHGRIPYPHTLRLLATALGVPFGKAREAAERQRHHQQMVRAAGSILEGAAESGSSPSVAPARIVVTFPDPRDPTDDAEATLVAHPTRGTTDGEHPAPDAAAPRTEDNEAVNRRDLLIDLAMVGLAVPLAGAEAVRQGLTAALAGGGQYADVNEWERIVHEYAHSYYITPTNRLLRDLIADLSVLQSRLEGATNDLMQRSLARVGAYLAVIAAKAWVDAGDLQHAGRWWRTARELADRSGDIEARTWVRAWEVTFGLYEQHPISVILDRAAEATPIAGTLTSVGNAQLYGGLAQTLAIAGRGDEALAALGRVADLTEQLPARVVADEASMLGWPEVRLRHTESYVHTWLGNTRHAYAAQEAALAIYPESLVRDRAMVLLHQGACIIQDGDVGGGLAYATRVLDGLPVKHHTEPVYATARAVMRVVPTQERGRPEAADLRARLALSPA